MFYEFLEFLGMDKNLVYSVRERIFADTRIMMRGR